MTAMTQPVLEPTLVDAPAKQGRWMVTIFNNDVTPFDDVIRALIHATGCDAQEAAIEAWEAHHLGKAPVHFASQTECQTAAEIIYAVGVKTEVSPEWRD